MSRPKTRWGTSSFILLLAISYLCFFFIPLIISLLITSGSFVLAHTPFFATTLLVALIPAAACRALFVEKVPEKRLGVLVNQHGAFKDLLLPGRYFIMPGREHIKELLTLEPASVQLPVLGLQASEGEVTPQVVIFSWRVQDSLVLALTGAYPQQVQDMIIGGRRAMEQEARARLLAALRRCASHYTLSALQALLDDRARHIFESEVQQEANDLLNPLGLKIERVELMNLGRAPAGASAGDRASAAMSAAAGEAQKTLAAAYKILAPLLRAQAADVTPRRVAQSAWNAYEALAGLRKTVNNLNLALQAYTSLLLETADAIARQQQYAPDQQAIFLARQKTSEELNSLQAIIGDLGKLLIDLELEAKRLQVPSTALTLSETERLLAVLAAIEQRKLTLAGG